MLRLGPDAAETLRASYLLVMLGSYVLLVPLAVTLWSRLGVRSDAAWATAFVGGLAYLVLGATGAAILAALTLVLGAASGVNALGSLLAADVLTLPRLTLAVLLAPVWAVSLGMAVVRGRLRGGS